MIAWGDGFAPGPATSRDAPILQRRYTQPPAPTAISVPQSRSEAHGPSSRAANQPAPKTAAPETTGIRSPHSLDLDESRSALVIEWTIDRAGWPFQSLTPVAAPRQHPALRPTPATAPP